MIVHMVCFKYKPDFSPESRADHRERLRSLKDLDGIIDLKVGEDVVKSQRSYDTGILVLFRDRAALDAYQVHPRHVVVGQLGRDNSDSIVAVDFEA
jgi:Stress responsive A/B Barrel Domain